MFEGQHQQQQQSFRGEGRRQNGGYEQRSQRQFNVSSAHGNQFQGSHTSGYGFTQSQAKSDNKPKWRGGNSKPHWKKGRTSRWLRHPSYRHRGSLEPVCPGLGENHEHPLGSPSDKRLETAVHTETTPGAPQAQLRDARCHQSGCRCKQGSVQVDEKARYRTRSPRPGVLQPSVPCPQKDWRKENSDKSKATKCIHQKETFQTVYY